MSHNNKAESLMTAEELAAYLSLAVGTIYNRVSGGEIPHVKIGRAVRFRRADIDAWLERQAKPAEEVA